jgi:hypothetical protein
MGSVQRLFGKLGGKKKSQAPTPLAEGLPYPVQVRRRVYEEERVRKRGGLQVFDTPEALALNDARMTHLESLGLGLAGKRVLDVGAGVGHLAVRLEKMGCSVVCVEGRPENVESLRQRYPQFEAHVGNVQAEPLTHRPSRRRLLLRLALPSRESLAVSAQHGRCRQRHAAPRDDHL